MNAWPFLKTDGNITYQPPDSPQTEAWISRPQDFALMVAAPWRNQPVNIAYDIGVTENINQVLNGAVFAVPYYTQPANLVDPQPAQVQGSTMWATVIKRLRAIQSMLPGVP